MQRARTHRVAAAAGRPVWINAYRVLGPYAPRWLRQQRPRPRNAPTPSTSTPVKSVWVELTGATRDPFKLG